MSSSLGTALITGASSGMGATYADRLARRGAAAPGGFALTAIIYMTSDI
jgi:NAD(P)-dependent dehydrogenase (short-subunit alcohol dehydrogenase family)